MRRRLVRFALAAMLGAPMLTAAAMVAAPEIASANTCSLSPITTPSGYTLYYQGRISCSYTSSQYEIQDWVQRCSAVMPILGNCVSSDNVGYSHDDKSATNPPLSWYSPTYSFGATSNNRYRVVVNGWYYGPGKTSIGQVISNEIYFS